MKGTFVIAYPSTSTRKPRLHFLLPYFLLSWRWQRLGTPSNDIQPKFSNLHSLKLSHSDLTQHQPTQLIKTIRIQTPTPSLEAGRPPPIPRLRRPSWRDSAATTPRRSRSFGCSTSTRWSCRGRTSAVRTRPSAKLLAVPKPRSRPPKPPPPRPEPPSARFSRRSSAKPWYGFLYSCSPLFIFIFSSIFYVFRCC